MIFFRVGTRNFSRPAAIALATGRPMVIQIFGSASDKRRSFGDWWLAALMFGRRARREAHNQIRID